MQTTDAAQGLDGEQARGEATTNSTSQNKILHNGRLETVLHFCLNLPSEKKSGIALVIFQTIKEANEEPERQRGREKHF